MPELAQTENPAARRWHRWLLAASVAVALLLGGVAIVLAFAADDYAERRLRLKTIELLKDRFDSEVELQRVEVQFRPSLRVRFDGLSLRHQGRHDIPPVIAIRAFTVEASLWELWNRRIDRVHLEGLEIAIPPRRGDEMPKVAEKDDAEPAENNNRRRPDVLIHEIVSEDATLTIMPKREGKLPRVFDIYRVRLEAFQFARPTPFEASLSNPVPKGDIETVGTFGPWSAEEPSLTPVTGTFTFDADLGTIKGIGGTLDSEGEFSGPLERIEARGQTRTPDFRIVALEGNALPLTTTFNATVDGTNGDVILNEVRATIGQSLFITKGPIVGVKGVKGRHITLDVVTEGGRLEDVLLLSMKGPKPAMTGRLSMHATLDLPPRGVDADVIERMTLDGDFQIDHAQFTSDQVQSKIDGFARRGQGRPTDMSVDNVMSNLKGRIHLADGRMRLTNIRFAVPGASVAMNGTYDLRRETLDFAGVVRLQARASQTVTGYRSFLLKPFDLILRKQGAGTRLAINVGGTRDQPKFGVDVGRTLKGK